MDIRGMTARERLRSMLVEKMQQEVVAPQAIASDAGAVQPSDRDMSASFEAPATSRKRKLKTLKCPIISCDESFSRMQQVIEHLNKTHDQKLEVQHFKFSTEAEFDEWIHNVKRSTLCNFLRVHVKKWSSAVHSYYYCSRSGSSRITTEPRKRHLKVQGYSKINRTCPAHVIKHVTDDGISVDYYAKHLCYTDTFEQLGHVRLSVADREWLAGKLSLKIPLEAILREVRNTLDGQLTRLHIVTRQDLLNIEKAFHLNKPERRHVDDATSVSAFVRSFDGKDNSPVLAYKPQGAGQFDILPEGVDASFASEDFFLAMMDISQCRMLQIHGNGPMSVICVDSTHGTNSYNFELTTVMVLDSNRQGFPVAFLYSNKVTEDVFKVFFQALKARCGVIESTTFMSDMAPQFFNAWRAVMGTCEHRLYCAWHVDKAFRENCRRLIKDKEKVVSVYKSLRTLMDESDSVTFDAALPNFVTELNNDADTAAFHKYFMAQYSKCVDRWAYSYRARCGINTNMHLERMHGILKHIYLNGKKNKRLDSAIASLACLVHDKQFERLTTICKGKYTKKLSELRKRHAAGITMTSINCEMIPGKEWCIRSESEETNYYTVRLANTECDCRIKCNDCVACIHRYSCNCPDNQTFFNMCKHIHYIGMLNVRMEMRSKAVLQHSGDSDRGDTDQFHIGSTDRIRIRQECEAAAHIQQLCHTTTKLEEKQKRFEEHLLETSLFVRSLTSPDEIDVADATLCSIKQKVTAIRAGKELMTLTSLVPTADSRKEPYNKNIEKQRRFFSTKRRAPAASSSTLSKPSNEERKEIQLALLRTNLTENPIADVLC